MSDKSVLLHVFYGEEGPWPPLSYKSFANMRIMLSRNQIHYHIVVKLDRPIIESSLSCWWLDRTELHWFHSLKTAGSIDEPRRLEEYILVLPISHDSLSGHYKASSQYIYCNLMMTLQTQFWHAYDDMIVFLITRKVLISLSIFHFYFWHACDSLLYPKEGFDIPFTFQTFQK